MLQVTLKDLVINRCGAAMDRCDDGDGRGAVEALGDLWPMPGAEVVGELRAEALLAIGMTNFCLAVAGQSTHETAKDCLSESQRLFAANPRADLAAVSLANTYLRQGEAGEALSLLQDVVSRTDDPQVMVSASVSLAFVFVEGSRFWEAMNALNAVSQMVDEQRPSLRGKFHTQRGVSLRALGELDRAYQEYEAARYCFEIAGNRRYEAAILNNLANLSADQGRFDEAHVYSDEAARILSRLGDRSFLARARDTKAHLYLKQGKLTEALQEITEAARLLSGDDKCWLPGILISRGTILARQRSNKAKADFLRAAQGSELSGNLRDAGRAYLTMIEEVALPVKERAEYWRRANSLPVDLNQLRSCAEKIISDIHPPRTKRDMETEREQIRLALISCNGQVDKAARSLGLSGPGLARKLETEHRALIHLRKKKRIRRTSLIAK